MSKKEDHDRILQLVSEYYYKYHNNRNEYNVEDRISYAGRVYDDKEMVNLVDSALEFWLTSGRYTDLFEKRFSAYLGVEFCSLVNSGSSANLIAFMALTSYLLKDKRIIPGDEIITVSAGFPTTMAPIIQYGAVPVFVDISLPTYNIDVSLLEDALTEKTKAIMIAHTLGNPFDVKSVKNFCDKNNLWLIEDNCDALGSKYTMDGKVYYTGTLGDIGTSSFYPPHHMTTGEGGAVYTNNPLLHKIIRSLRDWGRDCVCASGQDNLCEHRFDGQFGQLPIGYDHKYVYSHFGYNLKATDMQAAIGCAQIDKLSYFSEKRKENHKKLYQGLQECRDKIILPEATGDSEPSWFGFIITCKPGVDRNKITTYLESHNIQTRLLFAGNIIKQPCFNYIRGDESVYRVASSLQVTDRVMNDSFWIGVYPGMTDEMIDKMIRCIKEGINGQ